MVNINYLDIKQKLSDKIFETGWYFVEDYLFTDEFQKTLEYLVNDVNNGNRFTPQIKNILKPFEECHFDNTKVIIVGQDPYPNIVFKNNKGYNAADGLAFSCSITKQEQSSLSKMFDVLQKSNSDYNRDPDLTRWANQGVLLINTALTTKINNVGAHYHIWKDFIVKLIKHIDKEMDDVLFVFMGRKAEKFAQLLANQKYIYCPHPASAAYNNTDWNCDDVFNKINYKLNKFNKDSILW